MRHILVPFSILVISCGNASSSLSFPTINQSTPEYALLTGARLVDLTVTGPGQLSIAPEVGQSGLSFMVFPTTIHGRLVPYWRPVVGPSMRLPLVYGDAAMPNVQRYSWDFGHGTVNVETGRRYLAIFAGDIRGNSGLALLGWLKRVDESGRLIDPALGFPSGTPVSTVLDPRNVPAELLLAPDAGPPADGG